MKSSVLNLQAKKKNNSPISVLTAYDAMFSHILEEAGIDIILIGDSVGTNFLGYSTELEVTIQDMAHHTAAVRRGAPNTFLISDLPYNTTTNINDAVMNAEILLHAGADCVKLEGWEEKFEIVQHLTKLNINVCCHIGYNPQIHGSKARIFGKETQQALELIKSAIKLENAGAKFIVLEKIPIEIAQIITQKLTIPTIGIGSGAFCDGQVLVINDIIGSTPKVFRHAKKYMDFPIALHEAVKSYIQDISNRQFPNEFNASHIAQAEFEILKSKLKD